MTDLTPEQIASRIGLEAPVEEETTEAPTEEKEKAPEPKEEPKATKPSEEEDEEADEEADEEEDEEEDEEPRYRSVKSEKPQTRTVPYSLLKSEREKRKALTKEIEDIRREMAEARAEKKGTDPEDELDDIELEAKNLAKELNLEDSTGLAKMLRKSVELAKKDLEKNGERITPELKEKLKLLEQVEASNKAKAEKEHFDNEWKAVEPTLKKQYPNASESELSQAKEELDKLAHSKEFHKYDLDYIVFKNQDKFASILKVSGKKGIEQSKSPQEMEVSDEELVDIEEMTPAVMKAREAKRVSTRYESAKDYKVHNPVH